MELYQFALERTEPLNHNKINLSTMLRAAARDITVWNMFQILWNTSESNTKQSTKLEYTLTLLENLIFR